MQTRFERNHPRLVRSLAVVLIVGLNVGYSYWSVSGEFRPGPDFAERTKALVAKVMTGQVGAMTWPSVDK